MTQGHPTKADIVKQARNLTMRHLELVYPSGLTAKYLFQTVCAVDSNYDFNLMRKDVAYLREKGYVTLIGGQLCDVRPGSLCVVKLTAAGLEIAQDVINDPALEI